MSRFRHYDILAKTLSRMTIGITFFHQKDVDSRARGLVTLVLRKSRPRMVVAVLESKALQYFILSVYVGISAQESARKSQDPRKF